MRIRITAVLLFAFAVVSPLILRAEELTRIDQLREQIAATTTLLDQATRNNEKVNLQSRLDRLKKELENQEMRIKLQERELELEKSLSSTPLNSLRQTIRRLDLSVDHLKEQVAANEKDSRANEIERDKLVEQRVGTRTDNPNGAALASELDEKVLNAREAIRALSLERDALNQELQLAIEADRITKQLKDADTPEKTNLTKLLQVRADIKERDKRLATESAQLTNLQDQENATNASAELTRQRLAQIDDEIALQEKQTGLFNSNRAAVVLLNAAKSQKKYLDQRLTSFGRQVAAYERHIAAINKTTDLLAKEAVWIAINYEQLKTAYLRRLAIPGTILVGLLVLYVIVSRVVLPLIRNREDVLLSRRLTRYLFILAATVVACVFLFDDLEKILTTLGIVSAAMVIALQDVCASIAGWFIIIAGAKFRIGDRIEVDGDRGDVLDIELLRTTILEVGRTAKPDGSTVLGASGNSLGADHPTGRIIVLPNNFVLKTKVFNATHGHPFIWCRQVFTFTNETPFRDVEAMMHRVLNEETAADFAEARLAAAKMEKRYGVSDAEYQPKIYVRLADWGVEFSCLHACHFRKVSETQSRIHRRVEEEMLRDTRFVTAYPTQRQVTGYESLTMPELAQLQNNTAVSAVASMPLGGSANLSVSDQRSGNGNGQHSANAPAENSSTTAKASAP